MECSQKKFVYLTDGNKGSKTSTLSTSSEVQERLYAGEELLRDEVKPHRANVLKDILTSAIQNYKKRKPFGKSNPIPTSEKIHFRQQKINLFLLKCR